MLCWCNYQKEDEHDKRSSRKNEKKDSCALRQRAAGDDELLDDVCLLKVPNMAKKEQMSIKKQLII